MNIEKLMKSFEAFINHDTDTATKMYREFFIESAQAINAEMEEKLDEEFGGDPEEDLVDEVVAEGFGDEGGEDLSFDEEGGEDEISFGDDEDHLEESIQMKKVADPGMKSETEADNVKPVLAKQVKSPVAGVSATAGYAGDGTVKGSNTKRDNPDSEKPEVKDQNNVMASGKKLMKPAPKGASSKETEADSSVKQSLIKDIRK